VNSAEITIRELASDAEMRACMDLQQRVWGTSELEVVPHHIFVVASRSGGQVLGAFAREKIVGFVLSFPAFRLGRVYLHSHMTAVLPEFQDRGIGKQLKLAQRQDALKRNLDLIEWTFDPLQLGNANFNINHLGAVVREYLPDVYGTTTSRLDSGLPTDRLVAEWWIRDARVEQILDGLALQPAAETRKVRLPSQIREIVNNDSDRARAFQEHLRLELASLFRGSFAITAFERDREYASYILEPYENRNDYAARASHAAQNTL
jgi:predicted GNAT superfamily acetyltransferase